MSDLTDITRVDELCPRCGVGMQATHHALCQHRDGTPTGCTDAEVRVFVADEAKFDAQRENGVLALLQKLEHIRYAIDKDGTRHNAEHLGRIIRGFELVLNVQFYPTPDESAGLQVILNPVNLDDLPF